MPGEEEIWKIGELRENISLYSSINHLIVNRSPQTCISSFTSKVQGVKEIFRRLRKGMHPVQIPHTRCHLLQPLPRSTLILSSPTLFCPSHQLTNIDRPLLTADTCAIFSALFGKHGQLLHGFAGFQNGVCDVVKRVPFPKHWFPQ